VGDALHEQGRVIVDVTKMQLAQAEPLLLFAALQAEAGGWPWVKLAVCGGDRSFGSAFTSAVGGFVPLYGDPAEAAARLDDRPDRVWQHQHLARTSAAPSQSRLFLTDICAAWQLPEELAERAVLATSELVTNAVEHAQSEVDFWVDLDADGLRVAVQDGSPALPIRRPSDHTNARGRGIAMVDRLADRWGVLPREDGKTVWILLRWPDS
jgi:anti-sigma regulatory factor (Ser/Thr protein kinase)